MFLDNTYYTVMHSGSFNKFKEKQLDLDFDKIKNRDFEEP